MFGNDRDALRKVYFESWKKFKQKQLLSALEQQVVAIVQLHPEYHVFLEKEDQALQADFLPEMGDTNPFLHMGMHLGLREQIATNRPQGIAELYQQLIVKAGEHDAEHQMMDCLAESIWTAQCNQTMPDEIAYLACLKKLLHD